MPISKKRKVKPGIARRIYDGSKAFFTPKPAEMHTVRRGEVRKMVMQPIEVRNPSIRASGQEWFAEWDRKRIERGNIYKAEPQQYSVSTIKREMRRTSRVKITRADARKVLQGLRDKGVAV